MVYTKEAALKIIVSCAEKYRQELDGRTFLFVTMDKHGRAGQIEFSFHGHNFLHLTGVRLVSSSGKIASADDFFHRCLSHRLSERDFDFSEDGSTVLKLDVLPMVVRRDLSANMIGDFDTGRPLLYTEKLAGSVCACMGFVYDVALNQYIPNTVLKEDIRNISRNTKRVIAIFRKQIGAERYEELTYQAKKIDWDRVPLPEPLKTLIIKEKVSDKKTEVSPKMQVFQDM